jgi:hypothetical protein
MIPGAKVTGRGDDVPVRKDMVAHSRSAKPKGGRTKTNRLDAQSPKHV